MKQRREQKSKRWTRGKKLRGVVPVRVDADLVVMHTQAEYDQLWQGVDREATMALADEQVIMPPSPASTTHALQKPKPCNDATTQDSGS
jgi:hypothetical protein